MNAVHASITHRLTRPDLLEIQQWVAPQSRVLDLGCGDGALLAYLAEHKQVKGYGLEIDPDNVEACIGAGVNVIEQNLNDGLENFQSNSFDAVIMTQALQAVAHPNLIIDEMLRIGRYCIITFPNFGHWACRAYLATKGRMPVSKSLPYAWYNTPNIHLCTFKDFEKLCFEKQLTIVERKVVDHQYTNRWTMRVMPNLFGEVAIYRLTRSTTPQLP